MSGINPAGVSGRKGGARTIGRIRIAAVAATLLVVAGCGSRPGPDSLATSDATAPGATKHTILVASTRARDPHPGTFYSGERTPALSFAKVDLTVPPSHQVGEVEWPKQPPGNPATEMVVQSAAYRETPQEFNADLKAELARRPAGQRNAVIFIHGYNTQFSEALYRLAQMAEDSKSTAVPVLFTWASRGDTADYVYDTNSATAARDRLEDTIRMVFASGADQVSIFAHSMGNWVTVEALRQIKISGKGLPVDKLGNIILAAPDIDVDVFKTQLKRFGKPPKPFIVVVSADDKALGFSQFIAGGKSRLGSYTKDDELVALGAVVADMTDVKSLDEYNHGKFAQLVAMAPELQSVVASAKKNKEGGQITVAGVKLFGLEQFALQQPSRGTTRQRGRDASTGNDVAATTPAATAAEPAPATTTEVAEAAQAAQPQ